MDTLISSDYSDYSVLILHFCWRSFHAFSRHIKFPVFVWNSFCQNKFPIFIWLGHPRVYRTLLKMLVMMFYRYRWLRFNYICSSSSISRLQSQWKFRSAHNSFLLYHLIFYYSASNCKSLEFVKTFLSSLSTLGGIGLVSGAFCNGNFIKEKSSRSIYRGVGWRRSEWWFWCDLQERTCQSRRAMRNRVVTRQISSKVSQIIAACRHLSQ